MIPALAYIVGIYVFVRCLDLAAAHDDRFSSRPGAAAVRIAAVLGMIAVLYLLVDVARNSARVAEAVGAMAR